MKSGATNPKKENAFCREPTLSEPPLACSASQGLADHPIGLSTAPALATFRTLRIHCPLTYYPTHAYIIRDQRSHAHTSENWPIKRLFFPRLTRAHTHAHFVSTVSHRRDARREHEPRKKKEKITTTWHTCPATFFTRVCGFGLATTRSSTGFLYFFFFYELFWNGKLIRTSVTIYSQRFSFYI